MKNPLKQMKQVQGAMAVMMYEVYLAGLDDGRKKELTPSLKEFSKNAKEIRQRGQKISKRMILNGEGINPADDAEKGA